jgi:hypothetical protein
LSHWASPRTMFSSLVLHSISRVELAPRVVSRESGRGGSRQR